MRVIDFTKTSWGHNIEGFKSGPDDTFSAFAWHHTRIRVHDEIEWLANGGKRRARITAVRPYVDPDDMLLLEGVVVWREEVDG